MYSRFGIRSDPADRVRQPSGRSHGARAETLNARNEVPKDILPKLPPDALGGIFRALKWLLVHVRSELRIEYVLENLLPPYSYHATSRRKLGIPFCDQEFRPS
jgi:hypothetical protein